MAEKFTALGITVHEEITIAPATILSKNLLLSKHKVYHMPTCISCVFVFLKHYLFVASAQLHSYLL